MMAVFFQQCDTGKNRVLHCLGEVIKFLFEFIMKRHFPLHASP